MYRNLMFVFLLTGIWHGAAWTFVVWGIWNGLFILLERSVQEQGHSLMSSRVGGHLYSLLVVNLGWVIFRAPNLSSAGRFISAMIGMTPDVKIVTPVFLFFDRWNLFVMIIGIILSLGIQNTIINNLKKIHNHTMIVVWKYAGLLMIFSFSVIRIVSGTYNPFIYFQF